MKVLVSAYSCEPDRGSEPGTGWNWVRQIARSQETWVLTCSEHRLAIEQAVATGNLPDVHWVYYDLPRWMRFWKRGERGRNLHYYLWQMAAYFIGRRLHQRVDFDLIHHVTYVRYWTPNPLAFLPVPFIFGPVGAGELAPPSLSPDVSTRGRLHEQFRSTAISVAEYDPLLRSMLAQTSLALATTSETAERMRSCGAHAVEVAHPPVGLTKSQLEELSSFGTSAGKGPVRFLSVGRLVHWKGFHLGLRAFAQCFRVHPEIQYWIVGAGTEEESLKRLAYKLGVEGSVYFRGRLPRKQYFEAVARADALLHPSYHDPGSWAVVEALASGMPVVCLQTGGPGLLVTDECGVRLPLGSPEQTVRDLTKAMSRLVGDPAWRARMGDAGRKRVKEHFLWDEKATWIEKLYERVYNGYHSTKK